ncbi:MAG: S1 family peptidase [Luteolibacter sp.]
MRFLYLSLLVTSCAIAAPQPIDDLSLIRGFERDLGKHAEHGEFPDVASLIDQLEKAPDQIEMPDMPHQSVPNPIDAVYLVGSVYKCGRCDQWHAGGVATAWALTADGLMITNHHVFANAKGGAMGVTDRHGQCHPVEAVLAADPNADLAIFRVRAAKLNTLVLGPDAAIGTQVRVIGHPGRHLFMQTSGEVARYSIRRSKENPQGSIWMSITADYAKGSSGGPVIDPEGRVVGVVCSTQSIHSDDTEGKRGPLQMVVKNCIPVSSLRAMLSAD